MPLADSRGRHRGTGHGRYITHPRHAVDQRHHVTLGVTVGTLAVANIVAGGAILHRETQPPPVVATLPLPTVTIPVPATAAPAPPSARRADQRRAKPRPIRLGTVDVAAFCVDTLADIVGARSTPDGWDCRRLDGTASAVDMNDACRWKYGSEAWGGMLDDADQKSWRCYRDPS